MVEFPPKTILAAVDSSRQSTFAWMQARMLAKLLGASLEVLDIAGRRGAMRGERGRPNPPFPSAQDQPLGLQSDHVHAIRGGVVTSMIEMALSLPAQLLVMPVIERRGIAGALFGSTAERIVRQACVPVMTVSHESRLIHTIVAPVNFKSYSESGLMYAVKLASALKARMALVHVAGSSADRHVGEVALRQLVNRITTRAPIACRIDMEIVSGTVVDQIISAGSLGDLIVLTEPQHHPIREALLGTTAEHVVRHSKTPVLTVPEAAAESPEKAFVWERPIEVVHA